MDHYCRDLSSPLMNSSLPTTPKTPLDGGNPSVLSSPSSAQNINTALYKTELCRSWEETGTCRYGVKCQVCSLVINPFCFLFLPFSS